MTDENALPLPKFPVSGAKERGKFFVPSERDTQILFLLKRYPYVRSSFVLARYPKSTHTRVRQRFLKLAAHRYIKISEENKSRFYILQLTEKGNKLLAELMDLELLGLQNSINVSRSNNQPRHSLMVSDIMNDIECSLLDNEEYEFVPQYEVIANSLQKDAERPLACPTRARYFDGKDTHIHDYNTEPDALFAIRRKSDGSMRYFALEAETGSNIVKTTNMRKESIRRKLLGIRHIAAHQTFKTHWGFDNLRYLFVWGSNPAKMRRSMDELQELTEGKGNAMIMFQYTPHLFDPQKSPRPTGSYTQEPWKRVLRDDYTVID